MPILFFIPCIQISAANPQFKLCVENLIIPMSFGNRVCGNWNKCQLIVGDIYGDNPNHKYTQHYKSSNPVTGIASCYGCLCGGTEFGNSSVTPNRPGNDSYESSYEKKWGIICPDVNNGRMIPLYDVTQSSYSNASTFQINLCPDSFDSCNVCRGECYQPQFSVGLLQISLSEQCFDEPCFTSSGISRNTGLNVMVMLAIHTVLIVSILYSNHYG